MIIQGFGNVGYWASKFFSQDGAIITTICEYNSSIHNPKGINIEDAKEYYVSKGTFVGFKGATEVIDKNPSSFMEKKADFLLPAASEKAVNLGNVERL
jgi:glutamate dehydrogenase (NAD(P)+)